MSLAYLSLLRLLLRAIEISNINLILIANIIRLIRYYYGLRIPFEFLIETMSCHLSVLSAFYFLSPYLTLHQYCCV